MPKLLEAKIGSIPEEAVDMKPLLSKAIDNLARLDVVWEEATTI